MSVKATAPDAQAGHCLPDNQADRNAMKIALGTTNNQRGLHVRKIPERAPTIPKCFQVRRVRGASVGMKRNWNLGDFSPEQTGFDNHLGGELHPGATLVEPLVHGFTKAAQATINVVYRAGTISGRETKKGIPDPPM